MGEGSEERGRREGLRSGEGRYGVEGGGMHEGGGRREVQGGVRSWRCGVVCGGCGRGQWERGDGE